MTSTAAGTSAEAREVAVRAEGFVEDLQTWLRIPSISADPTHHGDVARSAAWLADRLRAEGWPHVEVWDDTDALPAVYASWPSEDAAAPTVLVYGHHDVQPADLADGWSFAPFEPEVVGEELRGRGASDDKGHLAMVRLGIAAHLAATGADAPAVHLKLLAEGEEESGSAHLASLLAAHREALACDAIVVTDTGMVSRDAPTVCTGMRGMVDTEVVFRGASVDLHSGQFGGAVPNPVTELARLVAALHDDHGRVQVPGFYDDVRPPTDRERAAWAALPFDEPAWLAGSAAGARATAGEEGWSTYERLWARPTAEVNGLHGGYGGPGHKTIVPHAATAKLTFRLVADQDPARVLAGVREFVAAHTPPGVEAEVIAGGPGVPPLICDVDSTLVTTIREAMGAALGAEVLPAREGGSGPEALLSTELAAPLAFLGVMLPSDRIHAPDERAVLPLLLAGAEATAHLWRLLGSRGL
ncbi:M20/M25/M40 family metallo-hydrolase [Actinomycetospora sp. CA-101289]|uniref:M20/M25/M40 family metallo-hydrolase n=1 Tax=Actinomycetospora sp. CA-101289 TaxID=3239893 RepID=UPI003D98B38C